MVRIGELYRNWDSRATYSTWCNPARYLVREERGEMGGDRGEDLVRKARDGGGTQERHGPGEGS